MNRTRRKPQVTGREPSLGQRGVSAEPDANEANLAYFLFSAVRGRCKSFVKVWGWKSGLDGF